MTRPRILLINPNTSEEITGRVQTLAIDECGGLAEFFSVTARFGARYISDRASAAIAAHAVLDGYAAVGEAQVSPDAVVIACFGDPGFEALSERLEVPVVGFAEAGIRAVAREPGKFVIATSGENWRDMLTELVGRLGLAARLAGFALIEETGREPETVARLIEATARRLDAKRAVLGGTGLMPIIPHVTKQAELEIVDAHRVALREAVALAAMSPVAGVRTTSPVGTFTGLAAPLARFLEQPAIGKIPAQ